MYKFLGKLALLLIGIYILFQVPFFAEGLETIKTSFHEKVENVSAEIDRIREKYNIFKEKVDKTKETVIDIKEKVTETKEDIEDVFTSIDKATEAVGSALDGEEGEEEAPPEEGAEGEAESEE